MHTKKPKSYKECSVCTKYKETINSAIELLVVKAQAWDQSNKELAKDTISWLTELSKSSNVWWLQSHKSVHIKQRELKCWALY